MFDFKEFKKQDGNYYYTKENTQIAVVKDDNTYFAVYGVVGFSTVTVVGDNCLTAKGALENLEGKLNTLVKALTE